MYEKIVNNKALLSKVQGTLSRLKGLLAQDADNSEKRLEIPEAEDETLSILVNTFSGKVTASARADRIRTSITNIEREITEKIHLGECSIEEISEALRADELLKYYTLANLMDLGEEIRCVVENKDDYLADSQWLIDCISKIDPSQQIKKCRNVHAHPLVHWDKVYNIVYLADCLYKITQYNVLEMFLPLSPRNMSLFQVAANDADPANDHEQSITVTQNITGEAQDEKYPSVNL